MTKVSIIVCTYNRCTMLEIALKSLAQQDCETDLFEVIVVDNDSIDETLEIFEKFANYPNFNYFLGKKTGLSNSRNTGYKKAKGEYVAYMDDDAKADKSWVKNIIAFISRHPVILAFGGPYTGYSVTEIPEWFKDG